MRSPRQPAGGRGRAQAAVAPLRKNEIEAEAPDVAFARRNHERPRQLFEHQVFVRGRVDESDIGSVRLGQSARITETFRDRVFNGRVT